MREPKAGDVAFMEAAFTAMFRRKTALTRLTVVDHASYINEARHNPFIRAQIRLGIYTEDSFADEFLGVARSHYSTDLNRMVVEFDPYLLARHMLDVEMDAMFGYTEVVATHEYVHTLQGALSDSTAVEHERVCNDTVRRLVGDEVHEAYERALRQSTTISRVLRRISQLKAQ